MILVTVGMNPYGFDRLVQVADELAGSIDESVVIQTGSSTYAPQWAQHFDYASPNEMEAWISNARVVVTHCAAGSILSVSAIGRPLVVVPRLQAFGEAMDDHQAELAEVLTEMRRAVCLTDVSVEGLEQAIDETGQLCSTKPVCKAPLAKALGELLTFLVENQ